MRPVPAVRYFQDNGIRGKLQTKKKKEREMLKLNKCTGNISLHVYFTKQNIWMD